ncbi:MAG: hypothetical protein EOO65_01875, partial [Methanosarcinales archaeon]
MLGLSFAFSSVDGTAPLDTNLQPRSTSWTSYARMLYVDQPVGTGFSYVDADSALTTNLTQIAGDLVALTTAFFKARPDLTDVPFYVFSESYGGKMTVGFATALLAALDAGTLRANFKGIALGDSWISGESYTNTWTPWLRMLSVMDANQAATQVQPYVAAVQADIANGAWLQATNDWGNLEDAIEATTDDISFYNVLQHNSDDDLARRRARAAEWSPAARRVMPKGADARALRALFARHVGYTAYRTDLTTLMNTYARKVMGIIPASR